MTLKTALRVLVPFAFFAALVFISCGDDEAAPTSSSALPTTEVSSTAAPTTTEPATTEPATTAPATTEATTTPTPATPTTTETPGLGQVAVWPASDVVFQTPEEAAADFVQQLLGVPPVLGTFVAGDNRSGEIEVFSPGEGGPGSTVVRSLLLLRKLGSIGWFVIAAVQPNVSITTPQGGDIVPAAPLTVAGDGRGYEATIIVKAVIAGTTTPLVDPVLAMGGSLETPEPYTAVIDLTGVPVGSTVSILVRGDTGLETDPGEFSAIAVTIGP